MKNLIFGIFSLFISNPLLAQNNSAAEVLLMIEFMPSTEEDTYASCIIDNEGHGLYMSKSRLLELERRSFSDGRPIQAFSRLYSGGLIDILFPDTEKANLSAFLQDTFVPQKQQLAIEDSSLSQIIEPGNIRVISYQNGEIKDSRNFSTESVPVRLKSTITYCFSDFLNDSLNDINYIN